jgi:hypothetical protein
MQGILLTLGVLVIVAGCATPVLSPPAGVPATVSAPQAKLGDYWEYAVRDGYTGLPHGVYRYEVTAVQGERLVVAVTHEGRQVDSLEYPSAWNARELPLTGTERFRYDPAYPAYSYPLEPGKTWKTVLDSTNVGTGKRYRSFVYAKVSGWERIKVPAGEFDALRIERRLYAGNMEGYRTQEEVTETEWYVPSVRRAVRTQSSSQHFDTSRGGGDGGGEYPLRIRGDWLIGELVAYSR